MTAPAPLPNLHLVGAPKCATTALAAWLATQPQVFAPAIKEHHHLADDLPVRGRPDRATYLARYAGWTTEAWALDASISSLRSEAAPGHVAREAPGARAVAVVRNPVDAVEALYAQLRATDGEDAPTLAEALRLEGERAEGRHLPADARHPWLHRYRDVYTYVPQVARWYEALGPDRVHVITFDDLVADPAGVLDDLRAHLGLADDGARALPVANPRRRLRSSRVKQALADPPAPVAALGRLVPRRVRGRAWGQVRRTGQRLNQGRGAAPGAVADPALRAELAAGFADDVADLGGLLGRDLGHWVAEAAGPPGAAGSTGPAVADPVADRRR